MRPTREAYFNLVQENERLKEELAGAEATIQRLTNLLATRVVTLEESDRLKAIARGGQS